MARPGDRMVDVELVEDRADEPDASVAEGAGGPADGPAGRRDGSPGRPHGSVSARRRRWLLAAAAAAVVGLAAAWSMRADTARDRADDALVAAFADVPGISASLREPPLEPVDLMAPRWATPAAPDSECPASVAAGNTLLVCQVSGEPGFGGPTTDAVLGGTPDLLMVRAADDGGVLAQRELGTSTIGWAVVGTDLVVATRTGRVATVQRSGAADGVVRWSADVALPQNVLARQLQLSADTFVVLSGPVAAVLDADSGEVLGSWTATGGPGAPAGPGRPVRVVASSVGFGVWTSPLEGVWFDTQGNAGARLPGAPVAASVDDGSLPGVLLLRDAEALRAVDVHAGVLWEQSPMTRVPVRLDGTVILEDAAGVRALDLATGAERWSVAAVTATFGGVVRTDGVRLLTIGADAVRSSVVTAYDLRDGSPAWTAPLPAGT